VRWAALFVVLAGVTVTAYLIRGIYVRDGLALLVVVFLTLAAACALGTYAAWKRARR
jgi:hypothetical protein